MEGTSARLRRPSQSPVEIARLLTMGQFTPKFGSELLAVLDDLENRDQYDDADET